MREKFLGFDSIYSNMMFKESPCLPCTSEFDLNNEELDTDLHILVDNRQKHELKKCFPEIDFVYSNEFFEDNTCSPCISISDINGDELDADFQTLLGDMFEESANNDASTQEEVGLRSLQADNTCDCDFVPKVKAEMLAHDYSICLTNLVVGDPCEIHHFGFPSEVSGYDFLLSGKIARSGKENVEKIVLKVEESDPLVDDVCTLTNMIEIDNPCEVK